MLQWLLHIGYRLLDWLLVILCVFSLVFICQFLVNFYSEDDESEAEK
jgi:hypothetical protein